MKIYFKTNICAFTSLLMCSLFLLPIDAQARRKEKRGRYSTGTVAIIEPDLLTAKAITSKRVAPIKDVPSMSHSGLNTKYKEGIDVSHYQGRIDWDEVATSPISYVYMKATEGESLVDDTYERNINEARRVGLSVGSYHFYRPNVDWKKQFDNLTSVVKKEQQDLVPIIDIEHKGSVSDEKFIKDLTQFIDRVTKHYGKKPLLYTFHNFYNRYLSGQFTDYHWMIARYRSDEPVLNDGKNFIIWQYTSSGRMPGISGKVDRSRIMNGMSLRQLQL